MKLTPEQLKRFDDEGYLFFPNYFSPEETQILKDSIPEVFAQRRKENVREKTGDVVRTAFAVHTYHPVFEALVHHPRFVEPAEQILRDRTYIHQFKINGKAAFDGDVWQWHQDYGTWKADDDMPEARAMNLAVFVDEVNEFNGPLWFIPQS
ncbi:MAG: phytanoyl-CoA dioxygenase family protein, partial [Reyranella sp.]